MNTSSTFQSHENANQARNEHLHVESTNSIDSRRTFWAQNSGGTTTLSGRLSGFLAAVLLLVACNILTSCKHNPTGPTWRGVSLTGVTPSSAAPGEKVLIHTIPVGDIDDKTVLITLNGVELAWTAVWSSVPDTEALVVTIPEGAVSGELVAIAGNRLGIDTLIAPFKVLLNKAPYQYGSTLQQFSDLAWDGSRLVAVGRNGITSVDSTLRPSNQTVFESFQVVDYGNGRFLALGDHRAALSSDGMVWSLADVPFFANDVISVAGSYVATDDNSLQWSQDGVTWTKHQLDPHTIQYVNAISHSNGRYFAAGFGPTATLGNQGSIIFSEDGSAWHRCEVGIEYITEFRSIAAAPVGVVAVGLQGIVFSADLVHWTLLNQTDQKFGTKVVWTGTTFIVVGDDSYILTSADGLHWDRNDGQLNSRLVSVCSAGKFFVAAGQNMFFGNFIPADTTF